MKAETAALRAYLAFSKVATPAYRRLLAMRLRAGKESPERCEERFGTASAARPEGRLVWFHAASVGESLSILGLVRALLDAKPDLSLLITTTTLSSARLLADLLPDRATHQFAPYDAAPAVRRFLDHWQPDLAVWTESELWPRLLHETECRGIPMLLVNARVSQRTASRWRRWPGVAGALLSAFRVILVQEDSTARLMAGMGVPKDRLLVTGSLKEELSPPEADPAALASLRAGIGTRPSWVAASTHAGEEARLAAAHVRAFGKGPQAPLLIIAPRHPERGPALARVWAAEGLAVLLRSEGALPRPDTDIYIADTLGEMGMWYRLCPIAFVGGSLVPVGGHNPYEPAYLDCAVIHGPEVFNFAEIYTRLDAAGGALEAGTEDDIARALRRLQDPAARHRVTQAARGVLVRETSATRTALAAIRAQLGPGDRKRPHAIGT